VQYTNTVPYLHRICNRFWVTDSGWLLFVWKSENTCICKIWGNIYCQISKTIQLLAALPNTNTNSNTGSVIKDVHTCKIKNNAATNIWFILFSCSIYFITVPPRELPEMGEAYANYFLLSGWRLTYYVILRVGQFHWHSGSVWQGRFFAAEINLHHSAFLSCFGILVG